MEGNPNIALRDNYRSHLIKLCNQVKELIDKKAGREELLAITKKIRHLKHLLLEVNKKISMTGPGQNFEKECEKMAEHELAAVGALVLAEEFLSNLCKNSGKEPSTSGAADESSTAQLPGAKGPTSSLPTNAATGSQGNLLCAVCQKISSLRCARCRKTVYCSKEHQKLDWKVHKKSCQPPASSPCFKVANDPKIGRHLVATRLISEGELIFEEVPLITGPYGVTPPVCLGCYKLLNSANSQNCSRCNWPVCSRDCENSKNHKPECEITTKFKKEKVIITNFETNHQSYRCITVLRCLYLKNIDKAAWEKIDSLESHLEQGKNTERYDENMRLVVKFIPHFFNYHGFPEEDIARMAGIVDVNSHLVPLKKSSYLAIYDKGSVIEHSCLPNCSKSFTDDGNLVIKAARKIQEGEHLSISYTHTLWGRQERQINLFWTKYFVCECDRCSDPTELGTYFNSYKCISRGCRGYVVPVIKSSFTMECPWRCMECSRGYSDAVFSDLTAAVIEEASNINKQNPENFKKVLVECREYLHPNNYLIVLIELEMLKLFVGPNIVRASNEDLDFVINVNKHLIDLASKLTPADVHIRGFLYYRLRALLSEHWKRKCLSGKVDDGQLQQHLLLSRDLLEKAYSFLKTEPEAFAEGMITIETLKNVHLFKKLMKGRKVNER